MSGRTGKLTTEALAKREPRMVLAAVNGHFFIYREGQSPIGGAVNSKYPSGTSKYRISIWCKSFNLRYLLRCAKTMASVV